MDKLINLKITYALSDIDNVAQALIKQLNSKIILLKGNMGVGKTTLIKAIAKVLGSKDEVSSPTFSIVNEYKVNEGVLYHFDLYRLNSIEEAYDFGIEEYLYSNEWVVVEWPDIIKPLLPNETNAFILTQNEANLRQIDQEYLTKNLAE
ncbi:tRNA (adenosine(37)-N6)-threonylcarbamoyltransferase complex ATPase subunit type 1 TsaE [Flavobacteriaceae bacterium MHTCC 0001]